MAHYAKVEDGVVTQVIVADSKEWCQANLGGEWIQTSYNTHGGVHSSGGTPLRKNHAGIGYTYDEDRDAFIPKKPYQSWVLNEATCLWESQIAKPTTELENNQYYSWNESIINWEIKTKE